MRFGDYARVYFAVRRAGHSWWRAVNVCLRIRSGRGWTARDAGELRAQAELLGKAVSKR